MPLSSSFSPESGGVIHTEYISGNAVLTQGPKAPSAQALHFGKDADAANFDVKFFGATSGVYMLWDESADRLLLVGQTNNRFVLGAAVADTPIEVGALSGNFLALQMAFQNAGTTLSRLTGLQIDVDDTSTHSNTIACARFYSEKVSGVGTHEHWGIYVQSTITAGKVNNAHSVVGHTIVKTATVGGDGTQHFLTTFLAEHDVSGAATLGDECINAGMIVSLIGNNVNSSSKANADGAFLALIGGDSVTQAPIAAFRVARANSIGASRFQYGLDMYWPAVGGYVANAFGVADIRLAADVTIGTYAGNPGGNVTANKGSVILDVTNGKLYVNTDDGTTWGSTTS